MRATTDRKFDSLWHRIIGHRHRGRCRAV
eukprot:COSAG03_NODE_10189_length_666_cov_1.008818_1_plen_28_part_10